MKKRIFNIAFIICVVCINIASFAKPFSKDGYYRISNPTTRGSIITKGDGTIIMKSMDEAYEYIDILKDIKTDEPALIYRRVEGEEVLTKDYYAQDGTVEYTDKIPTCRMELYYLNGKPTGYNEENISYINNVVGNKVIYYNDMYNSSERCAYIYDYETNVKVKANFQNVEVVEDMNLIIKSSDPYGEGNKSMQICDYNFKVLKDLDGYSYEYFVKKKEKVFLKVFRMGENETRYYNLLDNNLNFVFDEDIDANIYTEDTYISTIQGSKRKIVYDFENMKVLEDVEEKSDDEKRNELEKQGYRLIGKEYLCKDDEKSTSIYNKDLQLIKTIDKKYNGIFENVYEDKVIYLAEYGFWNEKEEVYEEHNDIYDANFELVMENVGRVNTFYKSNLFSIDNVVYDFDFNKIKELEKNVNIQSSSKFDKTYFDDRYDNQYNEKDKYNVYDSKFNILYENVSGSNFYVSDKYYFIIKDGQTMVIDSNDKIVKTLDKPYTIFSGFDKKYYVCTNDLNGRYVLMNENFDVITKEYKKIENVTDDYFVYQNGFKYGLMDFDENVLVSFSIFDTMDEDSNQKNDFYY